MAWLIFFGTDGFLSGWWDKNSEEKMAGAPYVFFFFVLLLAGTLTMIPALFFALAFSTGLTYMLGLATEGLIQHLVHIVVFTAVRLRDYLVLYNSYDDESLADRLSRLLVSLAGSLRKGSRRVIAFVGHRTGLSKLSELVAIAAWLQPQLRHAMAYSGQVIRLDSLCRLVVASAGFIAVVIREGPRYVVTYIGHGSIRVWEAISDSLERDDNGRSNMIWTALDTWDGAE